MTYGIVNNIFSCNTMMKGLIRRRKNGPDVRAYLMRIHIRMKNENKKLKLIF